MNIPYSNPTNTAWMPASLRGLANFEANLMPDSEYAQKTWLYMETTLLSTSGPKTTIVGNVPGPLNSSPFC